MTTHRLARVYAAVILLHVAVTAGFAQQHQPPYVFPAKAWQHVPAESAGYSPAVLNAAREALAKTSTSALIAVASGRIVFEYGNVDTVSYIASARKSILSMLYGNYVQRGVISLDETLEQLALDDLGGLTKPEKQARVRDLLTARSGVYHAAANAGDDIDDAPPRGSQKPGAYFLYNNWDFNALGTIFEVRTKQNLYDALARDIAGPIGMEDFQRKLHRRGGDSTRSVHLAYHMYFSARDMARLGYLMLRDGRWNGTQVIPAAWVKESTRALVPLTEMNPPARRSGPCGYGYLWWVWDGPNIPAPYKGAYAAMGAFGQNIVVLPALDLVVVTKVIPGQDRTLSSGQFLSILDLIVRARAGTAEHREIQLPESTLQSFIGEYALTPAVALTITLENGALFAQLTGQPKVPIFAESQDTFFYRAASATISFTRDSTGAVAGLVLHQAGGRATPAKKKPRP